MATEAETDFLGQRKDVAMREVGSSDDIEEDDDPDLPSLPDGLW